MQYNILVFNPVTQEHFFREVRGYPITSILAPDITFFAHRPYKKDTNFDFEQYWNISEYDSGLSLVSYCMGTKQQVLQAMESRLLNLNTDITTWINEQKFKSIKLYGIANKVE